MRRPGKTCILAILAALALGGTARAASISVVNITPGGGGVPFPSDVVTVEVIMESEIVLSSYFFHVGYGADLSVVSAAPYGPYPYPTGSPNAWSTLAGNLSVDGYGLYLNAYASGAKSRPGTFTDVWITTLVFHVVDWGAGGPVITPYFSPSGDVIGDANFQDVSHLFTLNSVTWIPEPDSALLLGLAVLAIGYAGRRRYPDAT